MNTLKINILNEDAMLILKGMEKAGLISLPEKAAKKKQLAKQLRGTISPSRAKKMMETIEKERSEWDQRY
jgi:hypothetical protein